MGGGVRSEGGGGGGGQGGCERRIEVFVKIQKKNRGVRSEESGWGEVETAIAIGHGFISVRNDIVKYFYKPQLTTSP